MPWRGATMRSPGALIWAHDPETSQAGSCAPARAGAEAAAYPRPTNGIWFAMTVMNSTLVESGRPAM
jgi:hypothetical protein